MSSTRINRRLTAILAADVVGYSRLMGRDEEGTLRLLHATRTQVVDPRITRHQGRIVKTTGDGILAEFPSVVEALRCAIDIQKGIAEQNADVPVERWLQFRMGINVGDVIVDHDDIFGDGVNVASRLEGLAEPGGICISQAAWEMARGRVQVAFEDQGEVKVKNIERPVRVYRVLLEGVPARKEIVARPERSIAVLPFTNVSADPENEFFSDGVSEELINRLTKLPQLRVSSRTSSFSFKNKNMNVRTIAGELGVKNVLEGSVRRAGQRIRVTAQLIDAESDSHLWSEIYDRQLEDIFTVQDEIARNIVEALQLSLTPRQERAIRTVPTTNVQAYDYYLRGRKFLNEQRGEVDLAIQMFSRAIAIDPDFALAHAGLADAGAWQYMWIAHEEVHINRADSASRRALELAPDLAEAHAARAQVLSLLKEYDEAEKEFETAIHLDPTSFTAHYLYGRASVLRGRFQKAVEMFERASAVDPKDYMAPLMSTFVYRSLGKEEEALDASRRGIRAAERQLELTPDNHHALILGANAMMDLGHRERAMEWASRALAISPDNNNVLYNLACIYSKSGETEKALECLEKRSMKAISREWVEHDSDLDPIRDHPRFQELISRWH